METDFNIPHSDDAERAIIGNLMLDASRLRLCYRAGLSPADFFSVAPRLIYGQMLKHADAHAHEFDPVSLARYLCEDGQLSQIAGGGASICEMFDGVPRYWRDETFLHHVETVREAGRKRALLMRAGKIEADIGDGERTANEIAEDLKRLADELRPGDVMPVSMSDLVNDSTARFERRQLEPARGIRLGCDRFDEMVGGLHPGHLCILAARPSVGKTTLAIQWAINVCKGGGAVLFFSFEMSGDEIIDRMITLDAHITSQNWRDGLLSRDEIDRWAESKEWISTAPLHLRDKIPARLSALVDETRAVAARSAVRLIVIDYLGIMSAGGRTDNRVAELSQITRELKLLAREIGCPVLCLAQLNRSIENRTDSEPRLSDLRESGSLEQDADQVVFITPDAQQDARLELRRLHLEKNRHGRAGKVDIYFDPAFGGFDW